MPPTLTVRPLARRDDGSATSNVKSNKLQLAISEHLNFLKCPRPVPPHMRLQARAAAPLP
jgi:hypothetical protein